MENNMKMDELMKEIKEITKNQHSSSKVDEIRVMRAMLNDPDFTVSVYDKNKGYIGTRCPREEALKFVVNTSTAITGLDVKSARELAQNYEFTKRDASFLIENGRDFTQIYLETGRKYPIVQGEDSEAAIFLREVKSKEKSVPDSTTNSTKSTIVPGYNKVVCRSRCPKYVKEIKE